MYILIILIICMLLFILVDILQLFGYHKINKRKEVQTNEEVRFHIHNKGSIEEDLTRGQSNVLVIFTQQNTE